VARTFYVHPTFEYIGKKLMRDRENKQSTHAYFFLGLFAKPWQSDDVTGKPDVTPARKLRNVAL
jgi:hypothetical protein